MSPRPAHGSYQYDEMKVTCVEIPVGREDEVRKELKGVYPLPHNTMTA